MLMLGFDVGIGGALVDGAGMPLSCGGNEAELGLGTADVPAFDDGTALLLGALLMEGRAVPGLADVISVVVGATVVEGTDVDVVCTDGSAVLGDVLADGLDVPPMFDGA